MEVIANSVEDYLIPNLSYQLKNGLPPDGIVGDATWCRGSLCGFGDL